MRSILQGLGSRRRRNILKRCKFLQKQMWNLRIFRSLQNRLRLSGASIKMKYSHKRSSITKETSPLESRSLPTSRLHLFNTKLNLNSRWLPSQRMRGSMRRTRVARLASRVSVRIYGDLNFLNPKQRQRNSRKQWTASLSSRVLYQKVSRKLTHPYQNYTIGKTHYCLTLKKSLGCRVRLTISEMKLAGPPYL